VNIQCNASHGKVGFVGWPHHSVMEDAECRFPDHLTAKPSVHLGCESQHTSGNDE